MELYRENWQGGNIHETVKSSYWNKLAHTQVVINYIYSVAQMCTREDTLAHNSGALYIDDVMRYELESCQLPIIIVMCHLEFFRANRSPNNMFE